MDTTYTSYYLPPSLSHHSLPHERDHEATLPLPVPGKDIYAHHPRSYEDHPTHQEYPQYTQYHNPYASYESNYSISPPEETLDSSTTSDSSGLAGSYSVSQTDSSSNNIMGGNGGMSGIDLNDYMSERFRDGVDLTGMDRIVVRQAQTSGHLNAKHRELLELQAKAQARLAKTRARFAQGLEDAREVRGDLEWTQKKVASLQAKAAKKHSREYTKARARYPSPPTF